VTLPSATSISREGLSWLEKNERIVGGETGRPRKSSEESPGFLGSTSFSATIQQNSVVEEPLGIVGENDIHNQKSYETGIKVLSRFPKKEVSVRLNDWYLSTHLQPGFHKPTIKACLVDFWVAFGSEMRDPRKAADLERMSVLITKNGRTGLPSNDDSREWIAGFSGLNTRWETLGTLFLSFSVACISISDIHLETLFPGIERKVLIKQMKECVEMCIELSQHSLNVVVCNLLGRHLLLESVIVGDTALSVWRLLSNVVSTAVAAGLH